MELKDTELAYAAGVVDGEGCICIIVHRPYSGRKYGEMKTPLHSLQVSVTNTRYELMEWFQERFDGAIYSKPGISNFITRQPCFTWQVVANKAQHFLQLIQPYMVIKAEQVVLAIQFQERRSGSHGRRVTPEMLQERDSFKERMTQLNKPYLVTR